MTDKFKVDVSPEMQLYKILQRQSYGVETALAEFIDNSIQSFLDKRKAITSVSNQNQRLNIKINVDTIEKEISIEDNAAGINRKDFQRAIRMGHPEDSPHHQKSLSIYGIGMKSAAVWFSDYWTIETSCVSSSEKLSMTFNLNDLLAKNESSVTVESHSIEPKAHFTKITLVGHFRDDSESFFSETVLPYLIETFYKFLNFLDIEIYHDGIRLYTNKANITAPQPMNYPIVDKKSIPINKDYITWRKRLEFDYNNKKVKGVILIRKVGSYKQPGIRLLRNNRVIVGTTIKPNIPDELLGTKNKYAAQRIYGEFHLDEFQVNFMKTNFDESLGDFYKKVGELISEENSEQDFIQQATNYRKRVADKFKFDENNDMRSSGETRDNSEEEAQNTANNESENHSEEGAQDSESSVNQEEQSSATLNTKISASKGIVKRLDEIDNKKLCRLYNSLCKVSLIEHPILLYVGAWTFFESLATEMNKSDNDNFHSFFNNKINNWYTDRGQKNDFKTTLEDIHKKGNCTKHSGKYQVIDARQLDNDFTVLEPFIIYALDEIINAVSSS